MCAPSASLSARAAAVPAETRTALDALRVVKLHGRWLDVTHFAHPGGPVALSLAVGRDATVLFESCHPFTARGVLASSLAPLAITSAEAAAYLDAKYARELASSSNADGPYDFDLTSAAASLGLGGDAKAPPAAGDAFEKEVKALALTYFRGEAARRGVSLRVAMKATPARVATVCAMGLAFAVSAVALLRGWPPALLLAPTLCWVWMVNFWHDAAHFAWSADWRLNVAATYAAPWFSSPLMWYHQVRAGWGRGDVAHSRLPRLTLPPPLPPLSSTPLAITSTPTCLAVTLISTTRPASGASPPPCAGGRSTPGRRS